MEKNLLKESVLFITGRRKNLQLNGPKNEMQTYLNVLMASKNLYEALEDDSTVLSEIKLLVLKKNKCANNFFRETGSIWPL